MEAVEVNLLIRPHTFMRIVIEGQIAMPQGEGQMNAADLNEVGSHDDRGIGSRCPRYENSYDLEYEDGDSETRVPARLIRPLATAAPRDLIPTPLTTTSQAPPPTDVETGGEL